MISQQTATQLNNTQLQHHTVISAELGKQAAQLGGVFAGFAASVEASIGTSAHRHNSPPAPPRRKTGLAEAEASTGKWIEYWAQAVGSLAD